jgi:hypothetical protein
VTARIDYPFSSVCDRPEKHTADSAAVERAGATRRGTDVCQFLSSAACPPADRHDDPQLRIGRCAHDIAREIADASNLLFPKLLAMSLRRMFGMLRRMKRVRACRVSVVRCFFVMARLMVLRGLAMVPSRMT